MHHHFDKDIFTNQINYFYSIQGPRFSEMNELMAKSLEKKYKKAFKPIAVLSVTPNKYHAPDNYIVVNKTAEEIESGLQDHVVFLQEYEDLNIEFMESSFVQEISKQLLEKQSELFVYPFTTSFMVATKVPYTVIGPDPKIATQFDNKINQYKLFKELGLPCNKAQIFDSKEELLANIKSLLPCYMTAAFASGGNESGLIYTEEMLATFLSSLRDINISNKFVVADIFENLSLAPNTNAVVLDENKTRILMISDQILRGTRYLGNIYPSSVGKAHKKQIMEITTTIGNYLSKLGFRGLFGCDFLINAEGELAVVDLNPRRQGGYVCNALALQSINIDLTTLELELALGNIPKISMGYQETTHPKAWAHSKVKPYEPGQRLVLEQKKNSLGSVFKSGKGEYRGLFYEKDAVFVDGYVGHAAVAGNTREEVAEKIIDIPLEMLKDGMA